MKDSLLVDNKPIILDLVKFAILMNDVRDKSPSYVLEKFKMCMAGANCLDAFNTLKYLEYLQTWYEGQE